MIVLPTLDFMAKSTNPKGAGRKPLEVEKAVTSLYLDKPILKKIRHIAFTDEVSQTDLIGEALKEFITKWEKKNGPIPTK